VTHSHGRTVISPVLIVPDGAAAAAWYARVLGARERFRVGDGHLVALDVDGAPLFVREETPPGRVSPAAAGNASTACVELLTDDPDAVVERARLAGATGAQMEDHQRPWGTHRQGGFTDPWGHSWLVGDMSPLSVPPRQV
jgi:PhnB protein